MASRSSREDAGFSVVELIIAMFLLAILSLAVLPLLVGVTQVSSTNRTTVAATAFASAQLAPIRANYPNDSATSSCAALRSTYMKTGIEDPAGSGLRAGVAMTACPATGSFPGTVTVTVTVAAASAPGKTLVTLPSIVLVAAP